MTRGTMEWVVNTLRERPDGVSFSELLFLLRGAIRRGEVGGGGDLGYRLRKVLAELSKAGLVEFSSGVFKLGSGGGWERFPARQREWRLLMEAYVAGGQVRLEETVVGAEAYRAGWELARRGLGQVAGGWFKLTKEGWALAEREVRFVGYWGTRYELAGPGERKRRLVRLDGDVVDRLERLKRALGYGDEDISVFLRGILDRLEAEAGVGGEVGSGRVEVELGAAEAACRTGERGVERFILVYILDHGNWVPRPQLKANFPSERWEWVSKIVWGLKKRGLLGEVQHVLYLTKEGVREAERLKGVHGRNRRSGVVGVEASG